MSEHHKLSPSTYNARVHCVYWDGAERETYEANAGTHHHEEMHKGLVDDNYEPDTYVSRWATEWVRANTFGCVVMSEYKIVGSIEPLDGIFGTADVLWQDNDNAIHIADLKSFSDGTEDYSPQLMGYAALYSTPKTQDNQKVVLHILHGGTCKAETVETTMLECYKQTEKLILSIINKDKGRCLNKYCAFCAHIKDCPMSNNAVQVVQGNGSVDFSSMSLTQKLVVCETVEKLIKNLKEEAKAQAIANGGVLEADGIRYEIKERAGKGKVHDLCSVASMMTSPDLSINPISNEQLLSLCELPKTAFTQALKDANADRKDVKKKFIEEFVAGLYDKGEPTQCLTRVN